MAAVHLNKSCKAPKNPPMAGTAYGSIAVTCGLARLLRLTTQHSSTFPIRSPPLAFRGDMNEMFCPPRGHSDDLINASERSDIERIFAHVPFGVTLPMTCPTWDSVTMDRTFTPTRSEIASPHSRHLCLSNICRLNSNSVLFHRQAIEIQVMCDLAQQSLAFSAPLPDVGEFAFAVTPLSQGEQVSPRPRT
jgi:hypothetical protein